MKIGYLDAMKVCAALHEQVKTAEVAGDVDAVRAFTTAQAVLMANIWPKDLELAEYVEKKTLSIVEKRRSQP